MKRRGSARKAVVRAVADGRNALEMGQDLGPETATREVSDHVLAEWLGVLRESRQVAAETIRSHRAVRGRGVR